MSKAAVRSAENFRFFADRVPDARDGLSLPTPSIGTSRRACRSARSASSRRGTRRSCSRPGRSPRRWPPAARSCTSRPSGRRSRPTSWRDLMREAGLPAGVMNTVHGIGEEAGKALTEHPDIKAIGFVGESATGSAIMRQGADDPEARALRARRQEPGDRLRRRRPRPRARRRDVHDLLAERRALHIVLAPARAAHASPTSSPHASPSASASSRSATRSIRRPRSAR